MILQILMVMDIVLQSKETKTTLASKLVFGLAKTMPTAFFLTAIYFFLPKTQEFPQIICMIQKKSISLQRKLNILIYDEKVNRKNTK